MERLHLAVRLHGTLHTAFPDGKPHEETIEDTENTPGHEDSDPDHGTHLTESTQSSTVVIFGDTDMLFDRFSVQEMNFMGMKAYQPINDNLTLFLNAMEQMAGSTDLVGIRARGKTRRPFHVVLDLERKAQERYLSEETRLQSTLDDAQQRLDTLQREKSASQKYILSPQQKAEIENFQKQVSKTRQELKLVRRKLRADIEKLGFKLKVLNILLMPALVILAGILIAMLRKVR